MKNQNTKQPITIEKVSVPSNGIGLAGFILSLLAWILVLISSLILKHLIEFYWFYNGNLTSIIANCLGVFPFWLLGTICSLIGLFKRPKGFAIAGACISSLPILGIIVTQIATPARFENELSSRQTVVIERIKDIRTAERAFRAKYNQYTNDFSTLEWFILNDSLELNHTKVAVIDTIFSPKKLTVEQVKELRYIPFSDNKEYYLEAGIITTESKVVIPVVECRAPYKEFLDTDTYYQEVVNLIDDQENNFNRYAGVKFGSMEADNNEAGNWED